MSIFISKKVTSRSETVLKVKGEIDIFSIEMLLQSIEACSTERIVLDCSGVLFIDSTGIGFLLRKTIELNQVQRFLTFVDIPASIYEVFDEMGVFEILEEVQER